MEVHCIRHGVTSKNIEGRFNGWIDEGITPEQAIALGKCDFPTHPYDAIYCSPMKRCIETAQALNIESWIEEPRLIERNLGIFEGKTPSECESLFAEDFVEFGKLNQDFLIPKGESRGENLRRVLSWMEELDGRQRVLAITHGGPIDFIYRISHGQDLFGGNKIFAGGNAHHSIFDNNDGEWTVIQFSQPIT